MFIHTNIIENIMHRKIDHYSAIPLHAQVESIIRELISEKEYLEGKLLPNEVDMAKRFGISRNTVRQAINKLVMEGLLVRKKGVGTKVCNHNPVTTSLNSWKSFTQEMNEKGILFKNYDIKVEWGIPPKEVADFFGISSEKTVLKMERLRGMDKGPIVYFTSYFHPRVGLTGEEDFSRPLYEMLEEQYHTVVAVSKEEISATIANKWLAEKLNVQKGAPILFRKRFVYDPGNRPVEYNTGFYNAEDFTYSVEIKK